MKIRFSELLFLIIFHCNFLACISLKKEEIVGGDVATEDQFKYYVSVQFFSIHKCGGAIIAEKLAITAAHCLFDLVSGLYLPFLLSILAGAINSKSPGTSAIRIKVKEAYLLDTYEPIQPLNSHSSADITILKLRRGLKLENNPRLRKVKIVESSSESNRNLIITGQGYNTIKITRNAKTGEINRNGRMDGQLRYAETKIVSNHDCNQIHGNIHEDYLCARVNQRDSNNFEGTCLSDSGGALVENNDIIVGILIGGPINCNETVEPGIYTNVSSYYWFIDKILKEEKFPTLRRLKY